MTWLGIGRRSPVAPMSLTGDCGSSDVRRVVKAQVSELSINSGSLNDLSFLRDLPLTSLDLVRVAPETRIEPVNDVTTLTRLNLASAYRGTFDAGRLTGLRECFLEWGAGGESLGRCESLRYLYLNRFTGTTLTGFSGLHQLAVIRVGNARSLVSLEGLEHLRGLRGVAAYRCPNLASVAAAPITALVMFEADTCKQVADWDTLAAAAGLRYISLGNTGHVPSVAVFGGLLALEFLWFPERTIVDDGQVRWMCDVPTLRGTGFQNRRHYDATREEVAAAIVRRHGNAEWYPPEWHALAADR